MSKVLEFSLDGKPGWIIHCPACGFAHHFDSKWTFNGDFEKPTFRASMLVRWHKPDPTRDDGIGGTDMVCHSFVTDGRIQFLGDCTHELRGQTVELPEV